MTENNLNGIRLAAAVLLLGALLGRFWFAEHSDASTDYYLLVTATAYMFVIIFNKKAYKTNLRYIAATIYFIAILTTIPSIYESFVKEYGPSYGSVGINVIVIIMFILLIKESLFSLQGNKNA